ncbi:peptidoglycan-binding protein [Xanthobacter sp. DSM 24535]|uniref:peptidoglycan-binding protein n=1 Tax=Roseixanthobacter psychrophilus TaxID=3119917 RepID=UPI003729CA91
MPPTFNALKGEYARLWDAMDLEPKKVAAIDKVARRIIANRARYVAIEDVTGVPWAFIGVLHNRESSGSFSTHLHNGDPLGARTTHVPKGRPKAPPANGKRYTWEESAIDAVRYDGLDKVTDWCVERCLFQGEGYNGWGYRNNGVPSAYLWSFSDIYQGGKYIADRVWSATAMDAQMGIAPLMQRLMVLDPSISFGSTSAAPQFVIGGVLAERIVPSAPAPKVLGPGDLDKAQVETLQATLRDKGIPQVGMIDGAWGTNTTAAIRTFQQRAGLPATGELDVVTAAALATTPKLAVAGPRADVTAADLRAAGSTEARANWRNKAAAMIIGAPAAAGAVINGAASHLGDAAGYVQHAKDLAGDVPSWIWLMAIAGIAAAIWWNSQRATVAKVDSVRSGQDAGPAALAQVIGGGK